MKHFLCPCLFLCLFVFSAPAADAQQTYSLKQCLETGLERNYSIRIVRNDEVVTKNNATPGHAGYLPSADLSTGFSGTQEAEAANAGVSVVWTIFDGFGIQAEYARLKELRTLGALNTRLAVEDLIAEISGEYYNLIRQGTRLGNLSSTLALSRERLRIVEERYSIGSMSRLDLQQAQVDFNADSSALLNQLEMVHRSRTNLNRLMGAENPEELVLLKDSTISPNAFLDEAELWKRTMETNVSLLIAQRNTGLSRLDLKKAQSRNYPYLRLNAGYTYTTNWVGMTGLAPRWGASYGLTVGFSLFDGFNRKREQRNARLQIENTELQRRELELSLRTEMSNQWMAYENNLNLWSLEKENRVAAQENFRIAIERYRLGDLSGIQLREAQNSLLNAEERQSIAEFATKLCEISLLQLSGQLTDFLLR
ncbi:MAG: TolC family protein [Tannerellaceae bacterium]|jgi:outer membrane protein TolC|nr:TolC family protein [Tannerellaceae bacterium]